VPALFTLKGYSKVDPLDKVPTLIQYLIVSFISLILSIVLVYCITDVFRLLEFRSFSIKVFEIVVFTFIAAPLMTFLRKSASWVLMLIIFIPLFIFDIYLQANVRDRGEIALWTYLPGTFIDDVKILPLRFLMTLMFDAFIFAPICLWLSRIAANIFYMRKSDDSKQRFDLQEKLFKKEWTEETIQKPDRDAGFWILRLLGFSYLTYLLVLLIGMLGESPWPEQVSDLISMTYQNPAMAINTFSKIGVMILLTFTGAYNRNVRYYCVWGLITGHAVSTISSIAFYFYDLPGTDYRDFLLTSAIVDGVMILLFIFILIKSSKSAIRIREEKDFPNYFSLPSQLVRIAYYKIAIISILITLLALYLRIFTDGKSGLDAVFGYPDPTLGNTFTLYLTVAFISILLAISEKLRHYLFGVLLFPFFVGIIITIPLFIIKDISGDFLIKTRTGSNVEVNWYFMIFVIANIYIFAGLLALRKMYYDIDFVITSISPSGAKNVIALASAFFGGDSKKNAWILQMIDQYIGGIKGRKRGLLNFPFWLVENVLNVIYGLHPNFSTMSRDEQRWFLKKYLFKNKNEIRRSLVPIAAEFGFQIGLAVNAMIMFANYSNINERNRIGYIPPDARDRLQGDFPLYQPPFKNAAPLPADQNDPANNKPDSKSAGLPLIAPRVTTPYYESEIPDDVDYLIIGSGAGGAMMSYRLACGCKSPDRILVVERGSRYQPLQDFSYSEMDMMRKLYKEGGLQQTKKFTMSVLQGECLGGTTVMNNSVCIKMSNITKSLWQDTYDIDLSELENHYDKIAQELEIKELDMIGINSRVYEKFSKGINGFNNNSTYKLKPVLPLMANYRNLTGDENWNLGNKLMRKRTMLETYLPWSESRGVKIVSDTTAVKFVTENNKAVEVLLRYINGEIKRVRINKAVIVAGGVIASSHFLLRSGINKNTGKRMSCNFAFPFTFLFDEEIKAYDGNQITLGAMGHNDISVFETYFNPPASFSLSSVPFYFDRREDLMNNYSRLINYGTLVGSEPNGVIQKKADLLNGQSFTWELGSRDSENIKDAFNTILRLGYFSGAVKAVVPSKPGIEIKLNENNLHEFEENLRDYPLKMEDLLIGTAHPQGGNIMTGMNSEYKNKRVINEEYLVEGLDNVYVSDASLFPCSMGLNPQWTIMAMSSMASEKVIERFEQR